MDIIAYVIYIYIQPAVWECMRPVSSESQRDHLSAAAFQPCCPGLLFVDLITSTVTRHRDVM